MNKIERFEDLKCWQKARELVKKVYEITKTGSLSKDFKLKDQLRSAAVSSMSNIAEGFARFHKKEFVRFLDISQSSAAEVKSLMYVVLDQKYIPPEKVKDIQNLAEDVRKLTLGLLKYVNRTIYPQANVVKEPSSEYGISLEDDEGIDLPEEFIDFGKI